MKRIGTAKMNRRFLQAARPSATDDRAGDARPDALDDWLKRELATLYAPDAAEPLPPDMAELAARLEKALASNQCKKKIPRSK